MAAVRLHKVKLKYKYKRLPLETMNAQKNEIGRHGLIGVVSEASYAPMPSHAISLSTGTSRKHAYIILTPLNPTFI